MYVTVTRVATGEQPLQNATIIAEEMTAWLRDMEGFQGMLVLSREGQSLGLTFWASQEDAERQGALRAEFVERMTSIAELEILDRLDYEVTFARLAPEITEVGGS